MLCYILPKLGACKKVDFHADDLVRRIPPPMHEPPERDVWTVQRNASMPLLQELLGQENDEFFSVMNRDFKVIYDLRNFLGDVNPSLRRGFLVESSRKKATA